MTKPATFSPSRRSPSRGSPLVTLRCLLGAVAAASTLLVHAAEVRAEVDLDGLFSRGAVLQRGVQVPVFGIGDDGDDVTITCQGKTASTKVKDREWRVELPPLEPGGPYTLYVSGTTNQAVKNVYVGDVWVCAGESNMQSPVQSAEGYGAATSASKKNRELHFYNTKRAAADKPARSNSAIWSEVAGSATVGAFSAIGYYFGRDIQSVTDVPVGLISCNHFSSSAEAWMSKETILAEPTLKKLVEDAPRQYDSQTPGKLYNAMVLPLSGYAIRGVIFYQGETNVERADQYQKLFSLLIEDWRKAWNRPDLPFLFVQLAGFKRAGSKPDESKLAELREAQLEVWKSTPGTAMVVSTDFSDPYSQIPRVKEPIGKRLALAARVLVYGEKFEYSGPVLREATVTSGVAKLTFDHLGDGLLARDGKLTGFTIAGADDKFVVAEAEVVGNEVFVKSEAVSNPKTVRYNWADVPTGNLFNKDGCPASPFRTGLTPVAAPPPKEKPDSEKKPDPEKKPESESKPEVKQPESKPAATPSGEVTSADKATSPASTKP